MRKIKTEINVRVVFDGKQNSTQAFSNLIIRKAENSACHGNFDIENTIQARYNNNKVFSDVRVAEKEEIA